MARHARRALLPSSTVTSRGSSISWGASAGRCPVSHAWWLNPRAPRGLFCRPPPLPLLGSSISPSLTLLNLGLTHIQGSRANLSLAWSSPGELLGMRQREQPLAGRSCRHASYPRMGSRGPCWASPCRGAKGLLLAVTLPGKPTSEGWQVKLQPQEPSYLGDPPLSCPPPSSSGRCPELGPPFPDPQRAESVERGMVIFTLLTTSLFANIFARSI